MRTNHELVAHLIGSGVLKTPELVKSFENTPRENFMPEAYRAFAYEDRPFPIGDFQTISQPFTVAFMLELLQPCAECSVLDVGSGSGWTTALLARCSKAVLGLERVPELVTFGSENLRRSGVVNAQIAQASEQLGRPGERFDRILVSASAPVLPQSLIAQLKPGGIMVVPVDEAIVKVVKRGDKRCDVERYDGFVFVPLISETF